MKNTNNCGCACGSAQKALRSPADAIMAICVLALAVDGKVGKCELERMDSMLIMSPLFTGVKSAREYAACVAEAVAGKGRTEVIADAAALLPARLAETAYAWAAQMVLADGRVVSSEHEFLSEIRKELGIHGVLAGKINAVASILNRSK